MNRENQEVRKLLTEIDRICKRQGIPYFLGPQLTLCSVTGQEIPGPHSGVIYMKTADMERFRVAAGEEAPDRRIVESMNGCGHPTALWKTPFSSGISVDKSPGSWLGRAG